MLSQTMKRDANKLQDVIKGYDLRLVLVHKKGEAYLLQVIRYERERYPLRPQN